jgi:hypothetical protein
VAFEKAGAHRVTLRAGAARPHYRLTGGVGSRSKRGLQPRRQFPFPDTNFRWDRPAGRTVVSAFASMIEPCTNAIQPPITLILLTIDTQLSMEYHHPEIA